MTVTDGSGKMVSSQITDGGRKIVFLAENVPAVGYKVYHMAAGVPKESNSADSLVENQLENAYFCIKVHPDTGNLSSVYDKVNRREMLSDQGNVFELYEDTPTSYDAWNVDADDMSRSTPVEGFRQIRIVETGSVKTVMRVTREFGRSKIEQDIVLQSGLPRIDFRTKVSWHEDHKMLKVAFPLAVKTDFATYEIPYAAIKRTTVPKTNQDRAKFEVSAHKWADMSEGRYGISLLNDCKYGYSAQGNVLKLSLLRSPTEPDPQADRGENEFTYSLYPHSGDWTGGGTVKMAYDLNQPLIVRAEKAHEGKLPSAYSFLKVSAPNVVLGAMKKAEDSDALILRFYESSGKKTDADITLPRLPKKAVEADLMEKETIEAKVSGSRLLTTFGPFEIKTFKVEF